MGTWNEQGGRYFARPWSCFGSRTVTSSDRKRASVAASRRLPDARSCLAEGLGAKGSRRGSGAVLCSLGPGIRCSRAYPKDGERLAEPAFWRRSLMASKVLILTVAMAVIATGCAQPQVPA